MTSETTFRDWLRKPRICKMSFKGLRRRMLGYKRFWLRRTISCFSQLNGYHSWRVELKRPILRLLRPTLGSEI